MENYYIINAICKNKQTQCFNVVKKFKNKSINDHNQLTNEIIIMKKHINFIENYEILHDRFLLQSSFDHKNICKTIDFFIHNKNIYTFYENCGIDLFTYITSFNINISMKINLILQLLDGINYLIINNFYHPDIKIDNICINLNNNIIKIIDFDNSAGTISYMYPEKYLKYVMEKKMYIDNFKSVIWSFFVVTYITIEEKVPFIKNSDIPICKYDNNTISDYSNIFNIDSKLYTEYNFELIKNTILNINK